LVGGALTRSLVAIARRQDQSHASDWCIPHHSPHRLSEANAVVRQVRTNHRNPSQHRRGAARNRADY
jgi:hypothetical protein